MSDDNPQTPTAKIHHGYYSPSAAATWDHDKPQVSSSERFRLIERTAYYLSERRGFEVGHELDDWLAAEREVDGFFGFQSSNGASS